MAELEHLFDEPVSAAVDFGSEHGSNAGVDDLFGDEEPAGDGDPYAAPALPPHLTEPYADDDDPYRAERAAAEYPEATEAPQPSEEQHFAQHELYTMPQIRSNDGRFWHVSLPKFLRIQNSAFDELGWDPSAEDAAVNEVDPQRANLPDENVIRWREGNGGLESNARIVRWEDGSMSLQVGHEHFDIDFKPETTLSNSQQENVDLHRRKRAEPDETKPAIPEGPGRTLSYLVADHRYARLLEIQASTAGVMSFTPAAIGSSAHRRLAASMTDKHVKAKQTRLATLEKDPEAERLAKEAEQKAAAKAKRKEKAAENKRGRRGRRGVGVRSRALGSDTDEELGSEEDAPSRSTRSRAARKAEEDDMSGFIEGSDDDEGEAEDDGAHTSRRRADDDVEDDLDDLETRAEAARARHKGRPSDAMDVDGPPAEETYVRKRLVIEDDSD